MGTNKRLGTIAGTLVLALGPVLAAQAPRKGSGGFEVSGPVRVVDGDTVEVYLDGHLTAVGLIGIKAPSGNTACGKRAATFTRSLVSALDAQGAPIKLRFDEDENRTLDARNRRLYYLRLPGDVSAALALVRAGLAEPDGTGDESLDLSLAATLAIKCVR